MNIFKKLYKYSKDLNVLYVEDDLHFREETYDLLVDYFAFIDVAIDGEDGLKKYKSFFHNSNKHYDLVISDINMPKMNGIELTKSIYNINSQQSIIIVSAHDDSKYLLELINLGIDQFLLKPLDTAAVLDVMYKSSKKLVNKEIAKNDINNIMIIGSNTTWNNDSLQLLYENNSIKLSKKETLFIKLLTSKIDNIFTINDIFNTLWQDDVYNATQESLKAIISRLRKKVPSINIDNVYGLGYKLVYKSINE